MEEIDLKELFDMFWAKKVFVICIIALFLYTGIFYTTFLVRPQYKSTSTLVLTKNVEDSETITQTQVTLNQKLIATYTELIKSKSVLRKVIANMRINISEEELRNSVSVNLITNSQLIEVSVINDNPELAKRFTDEITKVFIEKIKDIYKMDNISIVDVAKVENVPYNINHKKDLLIFGATGLITACGCVFIMLVFDTTIKTAEEVEKRLELPVLASIPKYNSKKVKKRSK